MMHLLADANPTPEALKSFLEVLTYLALTITAIIVAWKKLTGKGDKTEIANQPIDVRAKHEVATQADIRQVHGRMDRERREIDAQLVRIEKKADERADKLEGKLDANTSLTAEMSGQVKQINQNVALVLTAITQQAANK